MKYTIVTVITDGLLHQRPNFTFTYPGLTSV